MRVWQRILIAFAIILFGFSLVPTVLQAQEEREGLGISPTRLSPTADPGQTVTGTFTVLNESTKPQKYKVYVTDFRVVNEDYEKDFEPIPGADSLVKWMTVPSEVRELQPGEQQKLNYSIQVPADTVPKGYYGVIFAETVADTADASGVVRVKRVGSLVYLAVRGGLVEKGAYLGLQAPWWQRQADLDVKFRVENTGNVHYVVRGDVDVKNIFGKTVSTAHIESTVLPGTIRRFSPSLKVRHPIGLYKIEGELKFLDQTVSVGSQWVVVASPLWLGIILGLVLIWVVSLRLWMKRRGKTKKRK